MAKIQGGSSTTYNRTWHRQKAGSKPPQDSWEEQLYLSVGEELWENLLDSKKYIQLYENVMRWNDSAVEEAFEDAKNRFLAKIKGVPCDVPLPDPDANIDEVDWSDSGNPAELVLDEEETCQGRSEGEVVVIVGLDEALMDPSFCVGWGPGPWDEEDLKKENPWGLPSVSQDPKKAAAVQGGGNKWYWYTSPSRRCTPRYGAGYYVKDRWGQRNIGRRWLL